MITAVDTNVLLDVLGGDEDFGGPSAAALRQATADGKLVACDAVWAETALWFPSGAACTERLAAMGIAYDAISVGAAEVAADIWRSHRRTGARRRDRVVADFLIGAHAITQADRLLTRDRGFYRSQFAGLTVLDPTGAS